MKPTCSPGWPPLDDDDKRRILECFDSGKFWRGDGKFALALERDFATWQGAKYALTVTNGTHALEVALFAAGISYGDEVLVPAFTFMSSASSVLMRNALPIPIDVDPDTFCIDPTKIEARLSHRTKAIMPVHIAGHACDMTAIRRIADRHDLQVIEDCAHALGVSHVDADTGTAIRLGSIGLAGCFSFQASKVVVGGEGGIVVTDDESLYRRALSFANYGWIPDGVPYDHFMVASNYRMPELSAALIIGQISKVHDFAARRSIAVTRLESELARFSSVKVQIRKDITVNHGHFYFLIILKDRKGNARDAVVDQLARKGIPARRAYPSFHRTRMFLDLYQQCPHLGILDNAKEYASYDTPVSDFIAEGGFWLPHWFFLDNDNRLDQLVEALEAVGVA